MDATTYIVLIRVHLRNATFSKGQQVTLAEMGTHAFTLLHYALAVPVAAEIALPVAA